MELYDENVLKLVHFSVRIDCILYRGVSWNLLRNSGMDKKIRY
jgi:hypothetical protein